MTTDEFIGDVLAGIETVRPGLDLLKTFDAEAAKEAAIGLTVLYEALVTIRAHLNRDPDAIKKALQDQAEATLQKVAALKFGAQAP